MVKYVGSQLTLGTKGKKTELGTDKGEPRDLSECLTETVSILIY